jgi:hypothetical protein
MKKGRVSCPCHLEHNQREFLKYRSSGSTFLGPIASYFLAFRQNNQKGALSAREERIDAREVKWEMKYSIGGDEILSNPGCAMPEIDNKGHLEVVDCVRLVGEQYHICAFEILNGNDHIQS